MSIPLSKPIDPLNEETSKMVTAQSNNLQKDSGKTKRAKWLNFSLRLGCTIALLIYVLRTISGSDILKNLQRFDDGEIVTGIMIGLLGVVISAYQWQFLLNAERIFIDLRRLVNLYLIGITFNHFLPTGMGGDVVKAYYVGKAHHNYQGSVSAVVMSRITGFCGMLLLSMAAVAIWHSLFSQMLLVVFLLSCVAMCVALAIVFLGVIWLPRLIRGPWAQHRIVISMMKFSTTMCKSLRQPRALITATLCGAIFHLSTAANYYIYAVMFHLHIPFTFYLVAIPLVSLISFLPVTMNGFGLRELAFITIFASVHVTQVTALILVTLVDAQILLYGVIGGGIYLCMGRAEKKRMDTADKVTDFT